MRELTHSIKWGVCVAGILALSIPVVRAEESQPQESEATRSAQERTSARVDDSEQWEQGQAQLQQALQAGQSRDFYAQKLRELGYQITSINYDDEDYLEYEVVKGTQSYEVQIAIDDETNKAEEIDIAANVWQTEATERALTRGKGAMKEGQDGEAYTTRRGYRYSERDRTQTEQLVKELEALPTGRDKRFYRNELKRRGYQVTKVNTNTDEQLQLEAVKNGRSVELDVEFNEETGKSTEVAASTLWWESEATQRARNAQTPQEPRSAKKTQTTRVDDDEQWEQGQAQLQQALQPGQSRDFYAKKIRELGYNITSVNYDDEDYLEYEVAKGDQSYEVQIDIDEGTQEATSIEIDPNPWKTEATERTLNSAERQTESRRYSESE